MALLHVDLQEGFTGDSVVVRVNGKEMFQKLGVRTRVQTGYADSFETNVADGSAEVEVVLPLRNLSESIHLEASEPVYLGVSLTREGRISYQVSHEPFGYL